MTLRKIEIVTPVHNRLEETMLCMSSIGRSETTGIRLHVIIVDDGSTDGTAEAVRAKYPDTQMIRGSGNLWYTAGTNRGIAAALERDPDYVLAINNDQIFDENCIQLLVACAEKYPRSIVGGLLLNWETPHNVFQVSPRWELLKGGFRHWFAQTVWTIPETPWEVETIVGNCVLYPVAAIRECGLMDEVRLPQFGDAEYTPRMRRAGWRLLIEPRARVFCKPNDIVTGFRHLPIRQKYEVLFKSSTSGYSLRRRLFSSLGGAPSRLQGLIAFPISIIRILIGRSYETTWALSRKEPPLKKTFSSAVVHD